MMATAVGRCPTRSPVRRPYPITARQSISRFSYLSFLQSKRKTSGHRMLNTFITEGSVCQLVSWPFTLAGCAWQQWLPAAASLLMAFGLRAKGIARLLTFAIGLSAFYLFAIIQVMNDPAASYEQQSGWFLFGCLFLFPIASIASLSGLLGGDLFRIYRKRARENNASV